MIDPNNSFARELAQYLNNSPLNREQADSIALAMQSSIRALAPVSKFGNTSGRGRDSIDVLPLENNGFGVRIGLPYMRFQNTGIRPFIMREIAGKNIPIRLRDGTMIFRHASSKSIGKRRITNRDPKTGQILPGNRPIGWRHPGLKPKRFIERGIAESMPLISNMYATYIVANAMAAFQQKANEDK